MFTLKTLFKIKNSRFLLYFPKFEAFLWFFAFSLEFLLYAFDFFLIFLHQDLFYRIFSVKTMIFLYFSHVFLKNFRKILKIRLFEFANNCLRITVFSTRFLQNISFLKISLRRFCKFCVFSHLSCPKRGQNGADFCKKIKISCKNFMLTIIFILRYFSSRKDTQNLILNKAIVKP